MANAHDCHADRRSRATLNRTLGLLVVTLPLLAGGQWSYGEEVGDNTAQQDDMRAIAELVKGGARFERNKAGAVTAVVLGGHTTNDLLDNLKGLPHLERLTFICARQVTDDGLAHIEGLSGLKYLWFGYSHLTDQAMVHIKPLRNLTELHIGVYGTQFEDQGLVELRGLKKLSRLTLVGTRVTDDAVSELQKYLPECRIERRERKPAIGRLSGTLRR